jgi:hypothetical protein
MFLHIALSYTLLVPGSRFTAARVIATADEPRKARAQVEGTIDRLLKGLGY